MKVLFIVFHGLSASNGISKKILAQVKAFKDLGMETHLARYEVKANESRGWMMDEHTLIDFGSGAWAKLRRRIDYNAILHYVIQSDISLVYIRSDHNANPFTIHMVRSMKEFGCRVVMEVPTYPYDQEYITLESKFYLQIDRLFRKILAKHLDGIVTFSDAQEIFGQRVIRISNGIDFSVIPLKENNHVPGELHLLGVAEIHYWHGFDRVVKGLANYYQSGNQLKRKIVFHIVGEFSGERERNEILVPITENELSEYVVLHGRLSGKALDKVFDEADMGIGSLGRHRSNITHIKTLKNREYAARGLPFIYSEVDEDFEQMPYVFKLPADESPVDVHEIISFYDNLSISAKDIRNSIGHLSWTNQMEKLLEGVSLNGMCGDNVKR